MADNLRPVLEYRGVSYKIDGRWILRDVSLTVNEGETVVLLGRSGAGKTTMLKLANALLRPSAGEVIFESKPVAEWDPIRLRRRIGYVIQDVGLFPHWTVERNVGVVPSLEGWPPERVAQRVSELLQQVGLPGVEFGRRHPRHLSGGQRQRVGVARALAADPPLLLLDEPFGAVDPITRVELQRQFIELRQSFRKAAVFVTHDVREALAVGTRLALMVDGRIDVEGTPEEFLAAETPEARAFRGCLSENWSEHDQRPVE